MKAARAADRTLKAYKAGKKGADARPAAWRADHDQGGLRYRRPADDLQPSAAQGQHRQGRRQHRRKRLRAAGAVILGKHQCARTLRRLSDRQPSVRHHQERLGCAPHGGRLDRRRCRRRRSATVAAGTRQRYRRLGAQPGALQRHLLAEAHGMARAVARPCAGPAGPDAYRALHGHLRPAGPLGRRPRNGAPDRCRSRRPRSRSPAGTARADAQTVGQGAAHRRPHQQSAGHGFRPTRERSCRRRPGCSPRRGPR